MLVESYRLEANATAGDLLRKVHTPSPSKRDDSMIQSECAVGEIRIPVTAVNTVVVGAGAAGTSCALHLYDFFTQMGVEDAQDRIIVITRA